MRLAVEQMWYEGAAWGALLLPLAWLYRAVVWLRRTAYRRGWLSSCRVGVPVVVVGNLTVGGTGKTPLVVWIVQALSAQGYRPGIVSRGYGGRADTWPQQVQADSDPHLVGDEPVLLAKASGCPVVAAPDRVAAARQLVMQGVDVIVSDDGLQHYHLVRDVEIAVRDAARGYGNGRVLPAGPLREPQSRLAEVDAELVHGAHADFWLECAGVLPVIGSETARSLQSFAGTPVHAVAGIGHPQRFFSSLRAAGLDVRAHPFADHHRFNQDDLKFGDGWPILMTEKDAVKCRDFAQPGHWYVAVHAVVSADAQARLDAVFTCLQDCS